MNKEEKRRIKSLIAENVTEKAIDQMLFYFDDIEDNISMKEIFNNIITISARYNRLKNENIIGVITDAFYTTEKNKINHSILQIVDSIPESSNDVFFKISFEDNNFKRDIAKKINSLKTYRQFSFDFYLSYSKKDSVSANEIYENLTGVGFKVFKSEFVQSVNFGDTEYENIKIALNDSQCFILYGSSFSINSNQVGMEYEIFFKVYHQVNPAKRLFFIFQPKDFTLDTVPVLLKDVNVRSTASLLEITSEFLFVMKEFKTDIVDSLSDQYQTEKENYYKSLKETIKPSNIIKCPNCTFPLKKLEPSGILILLFFIISSGLLLYFNYSKTNIIVSILMIFIGGVVGAMICYMIGSLIETILNKRFIHAKSECRNCHYVLQPRDIEKVFKSNIIDTANQDFHLSIDKEIKQINKYFKENKIVAGLEELKILFLKKHDVFSSKEAEFLINDFLENKKKINSNAISQEDYDKNGTNIINRSFQLLEGYKEYIKLLREYAKKDKDFISDYLSFSESLEKINCKKYIRILIENGYEYKSFWYIDKNELKSIDKIAPGDLNRMIGAIMKEKQKVFQEILLATLLVLFLGCLFLSLNYLNYYNFEWTGLKNGFEIKELLVDKVKDYNFLQLLFLSTPIIDKLTGFSLVIFAILIIIAIITYKKLLDGGIYSNLFMILVWIIVLPLFFSSLHFVILYLSVFPISFFYFYSDLNSKVEINFINFFYENFRIAFFLRIIPFVLLFVYLPKLYNRVFKKY